MRRSSELGQGAHMAEGGHFPAISKDQNWLMIILMLVTWHRFFFKKHTPHYKQKQKTKNVSQALQRLETSNNTPLS